MVNASSGLVNSGEDLMIHIESKSHHRTETVSKYKHLTYLSH